jgi:hypothetical protein
MTSHRPPEAKPTAAPISLSSADVADLLTQIEDLAAAGLDATAPLSHRSLGRSEARRIVRDARRKAFGILGAARGEENAQGGAPG